MKILVINCGSSSIKYQLIQMTGPEVLASGLVERIGEPEGDLVHKVRHRPRGSGEPLGDQGDSY